MGSIGDWSFLRGLSFSRWGRWFVRWIKGKGNKKSMRKIRICRRCRIRLWEWSWRVSLDMPKPIITAEATRTKQSKQEAAKKPIYCRIFLRAKRWLVNRKVIIVVVIRYTIRNACTRSRSCFWSKGMVVVVVVRLIRASPSNTSTNPSGQTREFKAKNCNLRRQSFSSKGILWVGREEWLKITKASAHFSKVSWSLNRISHFQKIYMRGRSLMGAWLSTEFMGRVTRLALEARCRIVGWQICWIIRSRT